MPNSLHESPKGSKQSINFTAIQDYKSEGKITIKSFHKFCNKLPVVQETQDFEQQ